MMENGQEIPDMNDDGQVDEFDVVHLDKDTKRNAKEITYDLNPNLSQLIIARCRGARRQGARSALSRRRCASRAPSRQRRRGRGRAWS